MSDWIETAAERVMRYVCHRYGQAVDDAHAEEVFCESAIEDAIRVCYYARNQHEYNQPGGSAYGKCEKHQVPLIHTITEQTYCAVCEAARAERYNACLRAFGVEDTDSITPEEAAAMHQQWRRDSTIWQALLAALNDVGGHQQAGDATAGTSPEVETWKQVAERYEKELAMLRDYAGSQTYMSDYKTADEMRKALNDHKQKLTDLESQYDRFEQIIQDADSAAYKLYEVLHGESPGRTIFAEMLADLPQLVEQATELKVQLAQANARCAAIEHACYHRTDLGRRCKLCGAVEANYEIVHAPKCVLADANSTVEQIDLANARCAAMRDVMEKIANCKRWAFIDIEAIQAVTLLQDQIREMKDAANTALAITDAAVEQIAKDHRVMNLFRDGKVHYLECTGRKDHMGYGAATWERDDVYAADPSDAIIAAEATQKEAT
jgi:hypothetical protein